MNATLYDHTYTRREYRTNTWPRRHEIALRSRHIRLLGIHARVSGNIVPGAGSIPAGKCEGEFHEINQTRRSLPRPRARWDNVGIFARATVKVV